MRSIPVFIINLKKDIQKRAYMKSLCDKFALHYEFIDAVDGTKLNNEESLQIYDPKKTIREIGRELTKGEIGCALSHLRIYERMIEQDIEIALILEDDVDFAISNHELIDIVTKLPKDWECIMLGHHTRRSREIDTLSSIWNKKRINNNLKCVRFAEQPCGTYGYIINKEGALKRLNDFKIIDRPIDHWSDKKLNLYGTQPSIIKISEYFLNYSSITSERSNMEEQTNRTSFEIFKDKVRLFLNKLNLLNFFFISKSFFIQFKILKRY